MDLEIVIPSYNRAGFLEKSLEYHSPLITEYDVPIFVLDNASSDTTRSVLNFFSARNPLVRFSSNDRTIPPDENFEKALKSSKANYVWLLGDTYKIPHQTFKQVFNTLDEDKYDVIVINAEGRVQHIPTHVYTDRNAVLSDLGWHLTCLSTLIYSKRLLAEVDFSRYRETNFLQTGVILEYLSSNSFRLKWLAEHSVTGLKVAGLKKNSWETQTFEIWTKRWANFVFSLPPSYSLDSKLKCAMDHGVKSGLFRYSSLKRLRRKGILNNQVYELYHSYFPFTIRLSPTILRLMSVLPRPLFKL